MQDVEARQAEKGRLLRCCLISRILERERDGAEMSRSSRGNLQPCRRSNGRCHTTCSKTTTPCTQTTCTILFLSATSVIREGRIDELKTNKKVQAATCPSSSPASRSSRRRIRSSIKPSRTFTRWWRRERWRGGDTNRSGRLSPILLPSDLTQQALQDSLERSREQQRQIELLTKVPSFLVEMRGGLISRTTRSSAT